MIKPRARWEHLVISVVFREVSGCRFVQINLFILAQTENALGTPACVTVLECGDAGAVLMLKDHCDEVEGQVQDERVCMACDYSMFHCLIRNVRCAQNQKGVLLNIF